MTMLLFLTEIAFYVFGSWGGCKRHDDTKKGKRKRKRRRVREEYIPRGKGRQHDAAAKRRSGLKEEDTEAGGRRKGNEWRVGVESV